MKISELLKDIKCSLHDISPETDVRGITHDSRKAEEGVLFIAVKGEDKDGHDFVEDAVSRGATAVCVGGMRPGWKGMPIIKVEDTKDACPHIARRFYGYPDKRLSLIGVTGTNGKTTTAYLAYQMLNMASMPAGFIGTVGHMFGPRSLPSPNTTPGAMELAELFGGMAADGISHCVMEVSSHSLKQGRVSSLDFKTAVMTNVTGDHLDYHKTFRDYLDSKMMLFSTLSGGAAAILNSDDKWYDEVRSITKAKVMTYGLNGADVSAGDIAFAGGITRFTANAFGNRCAVEIPLAGRHNVYNALAAISILLREGIQIGDIGTLLSRVSGPPGRMEYVLCGQPFSVVIDYAHTADALRRLMEAIHEVFKGKKVLVFGCGGDRDRTKRPAMGRIAVEYADEVIITSDNPRWEEPEAIIGEVIAGIPAGFRNYAAIPNRREAIERALAGREPPDVVVIAGKGHENVQITRGAEIPFSDKSVVREILSRSSSRSAEGSPHVHA